MDCAHQGLHDVQGIRKVPTRLRIQISRRRNDDEDAQVSLASSCILEIVDAEYGQYH